jgi:pSer/pThr/pTyr-binding forkhead associated (FHA) protein
MKIKFLSGSLEGKTHELKGATTLGRSDESTLMLNDSGISSTHVFIKKLEGKWLVIDNASTNGVRLNEEKISQEMILYNDDILRISNVKFQVILDNDIKRPPLGDKQEDTTAVSDKEPSPKSENASSAKSIRKPSSKSAKSPSDSKNKSHEKSDKKKKDFNFKKPHVKLTPEEQQEALEQKKIRRMARKRKKMQWQIVMTAFFITCMFLLIVLVPKLLAMVKATKTRVVKVSPSNQPPQNAHILIKEMIKETAQTNTQNAASPLYIQSYPSGATIELDGEIIGTTPLELSTMQSRAYHLTLYKEGFKATEFIFALPQSPIQVHTLEQEDYSALITTSPPGVALLNGGQVVGLTPFLLRNLKTGRSKLTLSAPGYAEQVYELEILKNDNRKTYHMEMKSHRGAISVVTKPPGCNILVNGDLLGTSKGKSLMSLVSEPITLDNIIPGEYELTVSSPDGNQKKTSKIIVNGGTTSEQAVQITMVNAVVELQDESLTYGMIVSKSPAGDLNMTVRKIGDKLLGDWQNKTYKATEVISVKPSNMKEMLGITAGIKLREDNFKPILASIHDEFDDTDYDELAENAKSAGTIKSTDVDSDYKSLDLFAMQTKYMNKTIIINGKVSFVREGEEMYSIVFDDRVECYLAKDDDLKSKLAKIKGTTVSVQGLCIGVRGLDRIVVVNGVLQ